jgi:hypothetical protein
VAETCSRHSDREAEIALVTHYIYSGDWRTVVKSDQTFGPLCPECRLEFIHWATTEVNPWGDPHFPRGTEAHVIHAHLREVHGDRAPWGNAFIDDFGEEPPRVIDVHAWCHRADAGLD